MKKELNLATLTVKYNPVTSQTRIPLMANGTIDIECGSTTNNLTRQKQVAFAPVTFITGTKLLVKKSVEDQVVQGPEGQDGRGDAGHDQRAHHQGALRQGEPRHQVPERQGPRRERSSRWSRAAPSPSRWTTSCSTACIAKAKNPKDYEVVGDYLSYDPYGMMFRNNDDAFGVVVRRAVARFFGEPGQCNGSIKTVYKKWFVDKLPSGEAMSVPMSPLLETVCRRTHFRLALGRGEARPGPRAHGLARSSSSRPPRGA